MEKKKEEEQSSTLFSFSSVLSSSPPEEEEAHQQPQQGSCSKGKQKVSATTITTSTDSIVRLNVGGTLHTTTKATLTSLGPNFFSTLLKNQFATTKDETTGAYFIDRNGHAFSVILDYLRTGGFLDWESLQRHGVSLSSLYREAQFYCIDELTITTKLRKDGMYVSTTTGNALERLPFTAITFLEGGRCIYTKGPPEAAIPNLHVFCTVDSLSASSQRQGNTKIQWQKDNAAALHYAVFVAENITRGCYWSDEEEEGVLKLSLAVSSVSAASEMALALAQNEKLFVSNTSRGYKVADVNFATYTFQPWS
ncbi:BTB/POZ domain-containing protein kctd6 [Balamuthia mandrillaris]